MRRLLVLAMIVVCYMAAACRPDAVAPSVSRPLPTPVLTAVPSLAQTLVAEPTHIATETASPSSSTTSTPELPQSWMLIRSQSSWAEEDALWVIRADGREIVQLTSGIQRILDYASQPTPTNGETLIAYYGTEAEFIGDKPLYLNILAFPSLEQRLSIDVKMMRLPMQNDRDHFEAMGYQKPDDVSLAWSPDGSTLAFLGKMEAENTDIYLYSTATGTVERLTSQSGSVSQLRWSPDGQTLVYTLYGPAERSSSTIGGWYAVRSDGSGTVELYPEVPQDEGVVYESPFYSWLSDEALVLLPITACGGHLQTINIVTGQAEVYWPGCVVAGNVAPQTGVMAIGFDEQRMAASPAHQPGLYLGLPSEEIKTRVDIEPRAITWVPQLNGFLVSNYQRSCVISLNGDVLMGFTVADYTQPDVSPDGKLLTWIGNVADEPDWYSPPLWLGGPGIQPRALAPQRASGAVFTPDSTAIIYASDVGLSRIDIETGEVRLISAEPFTGYGWKPIWLLEE